jgi:hypothetical protein
MCTLFLQQTFQALRALLVIELGKRTASAGGVAVSFFVFDKDPMASS